MSDIKLNENTLLISGNLQGQFTHEGGMAKLNDDKAAYAGAMTVMPENEHLNVEAAKVIHNFDQHYSEGFMHAASTYMVEQLAANPDLQQMKAQTQVGNSTVTAQVKREGFNQIPPKEKGGDVTRVEVKGKTDTGISTTSTNEVRRIKQSIHAFAAEKL